MMKTLTGALSMLLGISTLSLTLAVPALAETRAGVVTSLEGSATVARAALPEPTPLRLKDDIVVRDRVTTGGRSMARMLLGGKAVVTVREHSTVMITEALQTSTIAVESGRVAVAVARERMRPGDLVEVKTPTAVAGVRGTIVIAEVTQPASRITVLRGLVDVTRLDAVGRLIGAPVPVGALQQILATDQPLTAPHKISSEAARQLADDFRTSLPRTAPVASMAPLIQAEVQRTATVLGALLPPPPSSGTRVGEAPDTTTASGTQETETDGQDTTSSTGKKGRVERTQQSVREGRGDKAEQRERGELADRGDKADRRDRADGGDRTDRGDRADRADKGDRSDKVHVQEAVSERADRQDKADRGDRPDALERSDKVDRLDKRDRKEKADRDEKPDRTAGRAERVQAADTKTTSGGVSQSAGGAASSTAGSPAAVSAPTASAAPAAAPVAAPAVAATPVAAPAAPPVAVAAPAPVVSAPVVVAAPAAAPVAAPVAPVVATPVLAVPVLAVSSPGGGHGNAFGRGDDSRGKGHKR